MLASITRYFGNPSIYNRGNVTAFCSSAGLCTLVYFKIMKPFIERRILERNKAMGIDLLKINHILVFGSPTKHCNCHCDRLKCCQNLDCCHGALRYLLNFIHNAKSTMDIAIYMFTHDKIGEAVKAAHERGVAVRIISDCDMSFSERSWIPKLRNVGILNRMKMSEFIMHHKYIIIDKELIIMGSMNFTLKGTYVNYESVFVSSKPEYIAGFMENFEFMWDFMRKGNVMPD